jgi:hypothetical protein
MIIIQPSASRTTNPRAPAPSSKLLGYYYPSALRTDNSTFWAKPIQLYSCLWELYVYGKVQVLYDRPYLFLLSSGYGLMFTPSQYRLGSEVSAIEKWR